jgi:hypothetical protein
MENPPIQSPVSPQVSMPPQPGASVVPQTPPARIPTWIPWVTCAGFSLFFLLMLGTFGRMEKWFSWRQYIVQLTTGGEYIVAKNQKIQANSITISKVRLNKPGFVTARFVDKFNSPSDYLVGETDVLPAGVHENVVIPIDPNNLIDQPHDIRILRPGDNVIIIQYEYDPAIDYHKEGPIRDIFGETVLGRLTIL